jgi:hypothetical protein
MCWPAVGIMLANPATYDSAEVVLQAAKEATAKQAGGSEA